MNWIKVKPMCVYRFFKNTSKRFGMFLGLLMCFWIGNLLSTTSIMAQMPERPNVLVQYLEQALQSSPEIQSAMYAYEAQLARIPQTGVFPEPQAMIGFFANPDNAGSFPGRFSIGLQQELPWPGKRSIERQAEELRTRASLYRLYDVMQNVLQEVQERWMDYYYFEQVVVLMDQQLLLLEDLLPIAESRFSSGAATQADLLRLEMEIQRATTMVLNHHDQIKPTLIAFNNLFDRSNFELIAIPDTLPFPKLELQEWELLSRVRQNNPELLALEVERRSFDKNRELARISGFPQFSAGIEIMGRDYAGMMLMDKEAVIGKIGIRIPIQRNRYRAAQQEAAQQAHQTRASAANTRSEMETEIVRLHKLWRNQQRNSQLYAEEILPRAEQIHQLLLESYANGDANLDEILQIQRDILEYKLQVHQSAVEGWKLISQIQALSGSFDISGQTPKADQF